MEDLAQKFFQSSLPWFSSHGIRVVVIIILALIVRKFIGSIIEKAVRKTVLYSRFSSKESEKKREDTLIRIFTVSVNILVLILAVLLIAQESGIAIAPLLAAAGVAGIAFGFGGQYLIRDLISGLFIIMENQYRIGDAVCFDSTCGLVEDITMRMTTLRDIDGVVHHIPHGEIKKVSNMSKLFARVNINVGISYNADLEYTISVINEIGDELANDPEWKESIIEPPKFLRIDDFGDSAVILKILGKTAPLKQWDVAGELRKRIKLVFDKKGIEIPFPQRVVHYEKINS